MKTVWRILGLVFGYLTWPLVWLVIRFTTRTRVLVVCGQDVLLLQPWLSVGSWIFPGGGRHRNEPPVQAALRELQEETGIIASSTDLRQLGKMKQTKGLAHAFYGFTLQLPEKPHLKLQAVEILDARWAPVTDLSNIRTQQHVALLLDAWQKQR